MFVSLYKYEGLRTTTLEGRSLLYQGGDFTIKRRSPGLAASTLYPRSHLANYFNFNLLTKFYSTFLSFPLVQTLAMCNHGNPGVICDFPGSSDLSSHYTMPLD